MSGDQRNTQYWGSRCLANDQATPPANAASAADVRSNPAFAAEMGQASGRSVSRNAGANPIPHANDSAQNQVPTEARFSSGYGQASHPQFSNATARNDASQYPGYQQPPASYQPAYSTGKDHIVAGLLAIFLGGFGIHKFYLGYNSAAFIMLGVTILGSIFTLGLAAMVMWVIGVVEGIIYLTHDQQAFDRIYVYNMKEWF